MKVLKNPVFLLSLILVLAHQLSQKVLHFSFPILDSFLDPLLCPPILLGLILMERRRLLNLEENHTFSNIEIFIMTGTMALIFELGFPYFSSKFTADIWDVVMYFIGAVIFKFWINR